MTNPEDPCTHDSRHYDIEFEQTCEEAIRRLTCGKCGAESVWRGDPETYFESVGVMRARFVEIGQSISPHLHRILDAIVWVLGKIPSRSS